MIHRLPDFAAYGGGKEGLGKARPQHRRFHIRFLKKRHIQSPFRVRQEISAFFIIITDGCLELIFQIEYIPLDRFLGNLIGPCRVQFFHFGDETRMIRKTVFLHHGDQAHDARHGKLVLRHCSIPPEAILFR